MLHNPVERLGGHRYLALNVDQKFQKAAKGTSPVRFVLKPHDNRGKEVLHMHHRAVQEQLQIKNLVASGRLDQELVIAHVTMVIQLETLGSLGVVRGSTPLVLSGLALIFLVLIIASKHLLRKGASEERRSTMETTSNVNTNISLSTSVHESLHEFAVSFGAGFLGGTIPSIVPLRLTA